MRVALFGLGSWGRLYWAGPLLQMADEERIRLKLVDRADDAPAWVRWASGLVEIRTEDLEGDTPRAKRKLPQEKVFRIAKDLLQYVSATDYEQYRDLDAAIVVTGAWDHLKTIRSILSNCPNLRRLICEKPCGDSLLEFCEIYALCEAAGVELVVTDHYLLRPNVQAWLADEDRMKVIGDASGVEAFMLEEQSEGPPDQDANLDMLVHLLNLVHTLIPDGSFVPKHVCMGRGLREPHAAITYCLAQGQLTSPRDAISCRLEVGKQLSDNKCLVFDTPDEPLTLNLGSGSPWTDGEWAYRGLLDAVLLNEVSDEPHLRKLGGIPASKMLAVWAEMARIRESSSSIQRYRPGKRPQCLPPAAALGDENPRLRELTDRARSAAEAAGRRLINVASPAHLTDDKGIDDFVTPLDRECEALLRRKLLDKDTPGRDMLFVGEETEVTDEHHVLIESDKEYWIVDPLDGTANAVAGRPEIAVSVALYRGDSPLLGVIHLPVRGLTISRDQGCSLAVNGAPWNPKRPQVTQLQDATVALPGDLRKLRGTSLERLIQQVLVQSASIRITGALAYDLAALALGEIDARISTSAKLVDVAAGIHLVQGVGGVVSDWNGRPWKLGAKFLAAGTKELHAELVSLCSNIA